MAVALGAGWHSREGENRAVGLGILVSLALHAALLLAFPGLLERKKPSVLPGPLTARLIPPPAAAPPAEAAPKPQPETPKPQAETPKPPAKPVPPEAKKPVPSAKPAPETKPATQATASAPSKPSSVSEAPAAAPPAPAAEAASPAPAVTARTEPQPAVVPATPSAEEAGTIARFRLDLIAAAKRFKRYPRVAMDNNWEGRTDVRIVFGADGRRLSTTIARSSGHEALDKQALDTLSKAFVPVPAALRGKQFEIEIPVIYSLKDENA